MADPFTIVQVVSAAASLAVQCTRTVKALHDLAGKFKTAEISILSTAHELDTIRLAWERIDNVLQSWEQSATADYGLLTELRLKLDFGRLVVSSLADDIDALFKRPFGFFQRSKYVWNEENFKGHQERVRGQVAAMTLLASVLNLPTAIARTEMLQKGASVLLESDESALSIVPSRQSSRFPSMFNDNDELAITSSELIYQQLSIDDDLFTARVYKRNYRHSLMFFKSGKEDIKVRHGARNLSTKRLPESVAAQGINSPGDTSNRGEVPGFGSSVDSGKSFVNRQNNTNFGSDYIENNQLVEPGFSEDGRAIGSNDAELVVRERVMPETHPKIEVQHQAPKVDVFKHLKVSIDDPCHKILPIALKKYNIIADWRLYALYIKYGDQERCLGLEEQPLILFRKLDAAGQRPSFWLRKHAPPTEGFIRYQRPTEGDFF